MNHQTFTFRSSLKTAIFAFCAIALCGCGKQHKAESVVKDFLDSHLAVNSYSVSFTPIDSTRHVTDSTVAAMRRRAETNKAFTQGIVYAPISRTYVYTQARIIADGDTTSHTFYLDPEITQVVAFKTN